MTRSGFLLIPFGEDAHPICDVRGQKKNAVAWLPGLHDLNI